MKINVVMPQLGESIAEGEVTVWLKQPGEAVERDESLVEVTTDKATVEIPAPASGTLSEILVPVGETVEVGVNIAVIETSEEQAATTVERPTPAPRLVEAPVTLEPPTEEAPAEPPSEPEAPLPTPAPQPEPAATIPMSPLARRLVKKLGLDPATIQGTGAGGRITREDVLKAQAERQQETAPAQPPAAAPAEEQAVPVGDEGVAVPLSPMRRRIAARLVSSSQTIPHVTTVVEVDMTAVNDRRRKHKTEFEEAGLRLTYTPFVMKAAVDALKAFPAINSSWGGDKLIQHQRVHLAMAVAVEGGLAVPVIRNADGLSLRQLAKRLMEVAEHARAGKLTPDELQGSTFTITNPGIFGAKISTPIINPPNAAILGLERIAETPVVRDGEIVIRLMTHLCLSYDHRVVDGETAIKFLQHLRADLEAAEFGLT